MATLYIVVITPRAHTLDDEGLDLLDPGEACHAAFVCHCGCCCCCCPVALPGHTD